jgi:hypothetical protein
MAMLRRQMAITPPPQWVRVVDGNTGDARHAANLRRQFVLNGFLRPKSATR